MSAATATRADDEKIKVFVLDDHEIVRRGLAEVLRGQADVKIVGEAGTAAEALSRISATMPDVAVVDLRLPDGSGIDVCREIRARHPSVHCLILTSIDDEAAIVAAVIAGADGYVLKQIRGPSLIDAIRRVAAGESLLDASVTAQVLNHLREEQQADERLGALNIQERRILNLIADGLTNREIGQRLFLAEKTIKNNVSGVLNKLGMQRRTQAAVYAANLRPPG